MKQLIAGSLLAWLVVSGDGHIQPASQDKIFYSSQSVCNSVAYALGSGARCVYVSAPSSMAKE